MTLSVAMSHGFSLSTSNPVLMTVAQSFCIAAFLTIPRVPNVFMDASLSPLRLFLYLSLRLPRKP